MAAKSNKKNKKKRSKQRYVKGSVKIKPPIIKKEILKLIASSEQPTSDVSSLSMKVPRHSSTIRKYCSELEEDGKLRSKMVTTKLYYFPLTGEVLTRLNYGRIKELRNGLKSIIRKYDLKDPGMMHALKRFIMQRRWQTTYHHLVSDIEKKIQKTVRDASAKSDLNGLHAIKPFPGKKRVWGLP